MSNFDDTTKQVLTRMMNLKEFVITVPVEETWMPNGVVPFDIRIKNGLATVAIPALTEEEARSRSVAYFNSNEDDDD